MIPAHLDPVSPRHRALYSEATCDALRTFASLRLPPAADYALVRRATYPAKPFVFPTLAALARRIHRARGDDALELNDTRLLWADGIRDVVEVLAHDQAADRRRRLGYAWLKGAHRDLLQAALADLWPNVIDPVRAGRAS